MKNKLTFVQPRSVIVCFTALLLFFCAAAAPITAAQDLRFDVGTQCCHCTSTNQEFCQTQFDHLNFVTGNGHYLAMGNDAYRSQLVAAGNALAAYHNDLNTSYTTKTGSQKADEIHQYVLDLFTSNGSAPTWVVLNEISSSQWTLTNTTGTVYRQYVVDTVHKLHTTYGMNVILYAPFPNLSSNDAWWQLVQQDAYIAAEVYLSGAEIQAQGNSVSWCQSQYQGTVNTYAAHGVPKTRLFLGEDFAQTTTGTAWGRSGVSVAQWDAAIIARSTAARNVGFAGFIGYGWGYNGMGVSDEEMTHFEDTYGAQILPTVPARIGPWEIYDNTG